MTKNERTRAAVSHQDIRILSCLALFSLPRHSKTNQQNGGYKGFYGESVMETRVQLKICEGCGCLWYRPQDRHEIVYCRECETKLKAFPSPESRRTRAPGPAAVDQDLGSG